MTYSIRNKGLFILQNKDQLKSNGGVNTENAVKFGWIQGVLVNIAIFYNYLSIV